MSPREVQAGAVVDGRDGRLVDDELDERFDRAMRLLRVDQLIRDLDRLERAWRRYEREHWPPMPGQLDLF
jgi:hypothetical protein